MDLISPPVDELYTCSGNHETKFIKLWNTQLSAGLDCTSFLLFLAGELVDIGNITRLTLRLGLVA